MPNDHKVLEAAVRYTNDLDFVRLILKKDKIFDDKTLFDPKLYQSLLNTAARSGNWQVLNELLTRLRWYVNRIHKKENQTIYTNYLKELYNYIAKVKNVVLNDINPDMATIESSFNALLNSFRLTSPYKPSDEVAYLLGIKDVSVVDSGKSLANPEDALPVIRPGAKNLTQTESYVSVPILRKKLLERYGDRIARLPHLINAVVAQERKYSDYDVFYHGQKREFIVIYDTIKEIHNWLNKLPDVPEFEYVRVPEGQNKKLTEFIKMGELINDNKEEISAYLLPVNFSLFGNVDIYGESTFAYFTESRNMTQPEAFLNSIFDKLYVDRKYVKEILELTSLLESPTGNLLQIFIPKDKVNTYVYPSVIRGKPLTSSTAAGESPLKPVIIKKPDGKTVTYDLKTIKTKEYLDIYRNNPFALDAADMDAIQGRMNITEDFLLEPKSGVKIFRYNTVQPEKMKEYKDKLHEIITRAMQQWEKESKLTSAKVSGVIDSIINTIKGWLS